MRAILLVGGRGTRMAPYTTVIPKPLLPVGDTPILEIIVRQLAHAGFDHITLTLGHLSEYFRAFIHHNKSLSELVRLDYVDEEKPTGTAGSVSFISGLNNTFLVMNGDILTTINYRELLAFHAREKSVLTIAAHEKPVKIDLGVIELSSNLVKDYIEKPTLNYTVSMGIYVYEPEVLEFIPKGQYLDFPDLVLKLIKAQKKVSAFETAACWFDLGRQEDFLRATDVFLEKPDQFLPASDI